MTPAEREAHAAEVERNYQAFKLLLPELLKVRRGWRALMCGGEVVEFYETLAQGVDAGTERYGRSGWSLQLVTDEVICIPGWFGPA